MVRFGLVWLNPFVPIKFTVLKPIEPAGKDIEEVVKEAELMVRKVVEK
jgi:1-acyl-sn-glycerol-3-phosphate acyltransferase